MKDRYKINIKILFLFFSTILSLFLNQFQYLFSLLNFFGIIWSTFCLRVSFKYSLSLSYPCGKTYRIETGTLWNKIFKELRCLSKVLILVFTSSWAKTTFTSLSQNSSNLATWPGATAVVVNRCLIRSRRELAYVFRCLASDRRSRVMCLSSCNLSCSLKKRKCSKNLIKKESFYSPYAKRDKLKTCWPSIPNDVILE